MKEFRVAWIAIISSIYLTVIINMMMWSILPDRLMKNMYCFMPMIALFTGALWVTALVRGEFE